MIHGWNGGAWGPGGFGFGVPWAGLLVAAAVLGLFLLLVLALVRAGRADRGKLASPAERGLAILTERFARGEIDPETFRSMRAELEAKG